MIPLLLALVGWGAGLGGAAVAAPPLLPETMAAQAVLQESLEARALGFARAWTAEGMAGLEAMLDPRGIRLQLRGEEHVSILPRQALAALRSFRASYDTGEVQVTRVAPVEGDPPRGFGEMRWWTYASGRTEAVIFTVFVAFGLDDQAWRITEIRILF